ncbi:MAG TPA: nuclear transport factor 2 family protein [Pyrinomonadaceae bacterium]|jgi:ketosteroid isomerase-like protein
MPVLDNDDKRQVRQLELDLIEAFRRNDTASLARILADDFVFTDPRGASVTKDLWLEDLASGTFAFESVEIEDIRVRLAGDAALVTGLATLKARSRAGSYNGRFGVVDVYMKREGRWQLALSTGEHAQLLSYE